MKTTNLNVSEYLTIRVSSKIDTSEIKK